MTYGYEGGSWMNDDQRDSIAGQSTGTADPEAMFEQQWAHVMGGLDRAVAWIKSHKLDLRRGFSLRLDRENGIEIHFTGYFDHEDDELEKIRSLFAGKQATRTVCEHEVRWRIKDKDLGLTFSWVVYRLIERRPPETTTVQVS